MSTKPGLLDSSPTMSKKAGAVPVVAKVFNPMQAVTALSDIVQAYWNYQNVAEQEQTKREEIAVKRELILEHIQAQRDVMMEAIKCTFAEREKVIEKHFNLIDQAVASNDNQQLAMALQGVTEVIKSSPFAAFADLQQTQRALQDPSHIWKI